MRALTLPPARDTHTHTRARERHQSPVSGDPTSSRPPPQHTQQPTFLKARVEAARAKASASHKQAVPTPNPAPAKPNALKPNPIQTAKPPKKGGKSRIGERCELGNAQNRDAEHAAVTRVMMARSSDGELAELVRPYLPKVFDAIMTGATRPGREGMGDRQTLFKMLGLPWSNFAKGSGSDASAVATERLATALSRLERRLVGQDPVTVDIDGHAEPVPILAASEVGHTMMDRLPSPPASIDGRSAAGVIEVDEVGEVARGRGDGAGR